MNRDGLGNVYLVGAGPGDPGLLTVKARDLIERADCIIHDDLIHPAVLNYARPQAEVIYAGKRGGKCAMRQETINALLVTKASEHETVVRLKGGDPFVFGRGGEEALALRSAGVAFEIVPGVSSGIAAAAYAGIPVTHRGLSRSVTFVTGHEEAGRERTEEEWRRLAQGADTLVIFMGVARIAEIARQLIGHGRDAATPTAVISWGSYEHQATHTTSLRRVAALVEREALSSPAVIVIGEVVGLREQLRWFDEVEEPRVTNRMLPNPFFELLAS